VTVKTEQVAQYRAKQLEFQRRANLYLTICVVAGIALVVGPLAAFFLMTAPLLLTIPVAIPALVIFSTLLRTARKSKVLLNQLATLITEILEQPNLTEAARRERILQIETNFLNNDDELYTKKFIWEAFLKYQRDKSLLYGSGEVANQFMNFSPIGLSFRGQMFIEPIFVNDGKGGKWTLANPLLYVLKATGNLHLAPNGWNGLGAFNTNKIAEQLPPVWMQENPLDLDNDDSDFVFLNWRIKRRIRDLYFAGFTRTSEVMHEIGEVASSSSVTFERMLRHRKVSKKLKEFKNLANLAYLTPASKMQLISFVDGVLQDRPYVRTCDSMIDLMAAKNAQIDRYSEAFWAVHRRSLKLYVAEALWLLLTIPLVAGFIATWANLGLLAATVVFVAGGAVVAFGQMAMITRQTRDLRAKKLTPSLISSLVAIRHNMCAETITDDAKTYEYEQAFKAAEKRFMLTVTEVEAVKLAKENVSDKVMQRLSPPMQRLRQNKEAQAHIYYQKFNHYRRICLRYGALELFVMLLAIPLIAALVAGMLLTGIVLIHLPLFMVGIGLAVAIEALLLRNHIRVARRKELYLLIYQKMAVLLSNYQLFTDPVNLAVELHKLENSVVRAAEIDNLTDVSELVSSIAVVDLGADAAELDLAHQNYQVKKEIGTNSVDAAQFQGSLNQLTQDFERMGTTE